MRTENTRCHGLDRPDGVRILAPAAEIRVDRAALAALCAQMGAERFDEAFEAAAFAAAEGFSRIEGLLRKGVSGALSEAAAEIAATARLLGLAGVAKISADLVAAIEAGDGVAAYAIGARLLRAGEESLIHAAEISVELGGRVEKA